ncbi:MAG: SRPBCC family protein [Chitinophagales bacterium]
MHLVHTEFITVPRDVFWKTWINVPEWHAWDLSILSTQIEETAQETKAGTFILEKGHTQKFRFTKVEPETMYAFEVNLPFSNIYVTRKMEPLANGVLVTHEFKTDGALLLPNAFYRSAKKHFRQSLIKLKYLVEENYWRGSISKIHIDDKMCA